MKKWVLFIATFTPIAFGQTSPTPSPDAPITTLMSNVRYVTLQATIEKKGASVENFGPENFQVCTYEGRLIAKKDKKHLECIPIPVAKIAHADTLPPLNIDILLDTSGSSTDIGMHSRCFLSF